LAAQEEDVDDGKGQVPQSLEQIGQWMQAGRNTIEDDMTTMTGLEEEGVAYRPRALQDWISSVDKNRKNVQKWMEQNQLDVTQYIESGIYTGDMSELEGTSGPLPLTDVASTYFKGMAKYTTCRDREEVMARMFLEGSHQDWTGGGLVPQYTMEDDRMQMLSDAASSALEVLEREATESEDEYDSPEELLEDLMEEMDEAEEPESEIECTNTFHVLMSSGTETSEASGTDDYNTAEEMVEPAAYDADAETDAADGVEGKAAATPFPASEYRFESFTARGRTYPVGKPCKLKHSRGVSLRTTPP
jgi:hypothetical protein